MTRPPDQSDTAPEEEGSPKPWEGAGGRDRFERDRSRERFGLIFESSPVPMNISSGDGTLFGSNAAFASFLGYTRDEMAVLSWMELTHPDDIDADLEQYAQLLNDEIDNYSMEKRYLHKDGTARWARMTVTRVGESNGQTLTFAVAQDIHETKRLLTHLDESEQRYRSLFEHHSDGVYTVDIAGRFASANHACESISGYSSDELLGKRFTDLLFAEDVGTTEARFHDALRGETWEWESSIKHKSGERVDLSIKNVPIVVNGETVGVYGIAKDVTQKKRLEAEHRDLEEQLIQAQKMEAVGNLAGGVAHDFNNLLFVIQANVGFLKEALGGSTGQAEIDELTAACERAKQLVRQLLAFSRKDVVRPETLDVTHAVQRMKDMLRQSVTEGTELTYELDPLTPCITFDRFQFEQVLVNLVVNARDASPANGRIKISSGQTVIDSTLAANAGLPPGDYVRIAVEDNGTGMTQDVMDHVFEPFFTTKDVNEGTGLGLSTVYGILKQAGGAVLVESELGQGSTFVIYLPPAATETLQAARADDEPADPKTGGQGKKILLVEDEDAVRRLIERILSKHGYQVTTASSPHEVLGLLEEERNLVTLLVTDVVMPRMSGKELAHQLASKDADLRVLYMSGYSEEILATHGFEENESFLPKPFTASELLHSVEAALAKVAS